MSIPGRPHGTSESAWEIQVDQCGDIFGQMFQLQAQKKHYDSIDFIHKVMTSKKLESMLTYDDIWEWSDECTLFCWIDNQGLKFKTGRTLDEYVLWFTGYLYKYWIKTRNMNPCEVYKILPIRQFIKQFDFYHTQGWEYIIYDATKQYNERQKHR